MAKKLAKNFWLKEFTTMSWDDLSPQRQFLLKNLADTLQKIRNVLKVKITVTSGLRTVADYHRLVKRGYNPSETSSHAFGASVLLRSMKKIKKFGTRYSYSVGAADIVPNMDVWDAYRKIVSLWKRKKLDIEFGQLIYESQGSKEWIHISNPPTLVYSEEFARKFLKRARFLKSMDGGKTYQIIK